MQETFIFFNMRRHGFLPPLKGVGFHREETCERGILPRLRGTTADAADMLVARLDDPVILNLLTHPN